MGAKFTTRVDPFEIRALEAGLYGPKTKAVIDAVAEGVAEDARRAVQSQSQGQPAWVQNRAADVAAKITVLPAMDFDTEVKEKKVAGTFRPITRRLRKVTIPVALVVSDSSESQPFEFGLLGRPATAAMRSAAIKSPARWVPFKKNYPKGRA